MDRKEEIKILLEYLQKKILSCAATIGASPVLSSMIFDTTTTMQYYCETLKQLRKEYNSIRD